MRTKAEAQAHLCASATKVMVGGTSIYVENETKVDYRKGIASASKQLKRKVVALGINYVDAANDVRTFDMRACSSAIRKINCASPTILPRANATGPNSLRSRPRRRANSCMSTGVVPAAKYAPRTAEIQSTFGFLLDRDTQPAAPCFTPPSPSSCARMQKTVSLINMRRTSSIVQQKDPSC